MLALTVRPTRSRTFIGEHGIVDRHRGKVKVLGEDHCLKTNEK